MTPFISLSEALLEEVSRWLPRHQLLTKDCGLEHDSARYQPVRYCRRGEMEVDRQLSGALVLVTDEWALSGRWITHTFIPCWPDQPSFGVPEAASWRGMVSVSSGMCDAGGPVPM